MRTLCAPLLAHPISFNSRPLCLSAPPSRVMLVARQGPDPSWGGGGTGGCADPRRAATKCGTNPGRGGRCGEAPHRQSPSPPLRLRGGCGGAAGIPLAGGGADGGGTGGRGGEGGGRVRALPPRRAWAVREEAAGAGIVRAAPGCPGGCSQPGSRVRPVLSRRRRYPQRSSHRQRHRDPRCCRHQRRHHS